MTDSTEAFAIEYPCDWACRIELDLTYIHDQYTHRQMRRAVNDCHTSIHNDPGVAVSGGFTVFNTRTAAGVR